MDSTFGAAVPRALWAAAASSLGPALRWHLRRRARQGREVAGRLAEREGLSTFSRPAGPLLWIHAASIGETLSALPVVQALPASVAVLFTTGTITSAHVLAQRLAEMDSGHRVIHQFVPLDVPAWCTRFLAHWKPDVACFVESELWPNMLHACRLGGVPAVLLNARMSVRSAARWCNVPSFAAEILQVFAWITAQSAADAGRLRSLGARSVDAIGNLKFAAGALPFDAVEYNRLSGLLGDRPRCLFASTHPGDEMRAASIHRLLVQEFPTLLTAIVPRHPERGAEIAAQVGAAGRRSLGDDPASGIWVADTLGELGLWFRLFPIVAMGKSFDPGGGQNPLEPARLGCAIGCGPNMSNFEEVVDKLVQLGGLERVPNEADLCAWISAMLRDPARRARQGEAARAAAAGQDALPADIASRLAAML